MWSVSEIDGALPEIDSRTRSSGPEPVGVGNRDERTVFFRVLVL